MKFEIQIVAKKAPIEFKKGLGVGVIGKIQVEYKDSDIKNDKTGIMYDLIQKGEDLRDKLIDVRTIEIKD